MMNGPWKEATQNEQTIRQIQVDGWEEAAFVIVMDIIHGHNREVSRQITLELLTQVSVVVDYYECHEAVEPFIDQWIQGHILPNDFGSPCIRWLCIAWVFKCTEIFSTMAELVVRHSENLVDAPSLPINETLGMWIFQIRREATD